MNHGCGPRRLRTSAWAGNQAIMASPVAHPRLTYRLNSYFDKISEFDGAEFADNIVALDKITGRVLQVGCTKGQHVGRRRLAIEAARARAKALNRPVDLIVIEY